MKIVILCGGRGTRIRDVSESVPKPMLPVGGRPILWHIMRYYAHWKHTEFVLCLGYKGETIKDFFLNYRAHASDFSITLGRKNKIRFHDQDAAPNWTVTLADTGMDALTGTRVRRVKKYLGTDENFMLTYGDGVGNVDLGKLARFHKSHGKILTISGVRPPGRFGELETDGRSAVRSFNEKPQVSAGRISGGFFVCRKEIFNYLPPGKDVMLEEEPMKRLVRDRQVMVFTHDGFWQPMDTPRDYAFLNSLCENRAAPWMIWK